MGDETTPELLACPVCRTPLPWHPHSRPEPPAHCPGCGHRIPRLAGRLPILVADPETYLLGERRILDHLAAEHRTAAEVYADRAPSAGRRAPILAAIAGGLRVNAALLEDLSGCLPDSQAQPALYASAPGADLFGALARDWTGAAETEAELAAIRTAIWPALETAPERLLVLGAGTGRLLCDLGGEFPGAIGVELSAAMAGAYARLTERGSLDFHRVMRGNFRRAADEGRRLRAERTLSASRPPYLVADATCLPVRDGAVDVVLSVFFTDLVPLSKLLPEALRVLRTGGRFIHFGPLGYAFDDPAEHHALDELPDVFAAQGFCPLQEAHVPVPFLADATRLNRTGFDAVLFVAERRALS